jgi:hypothetical protein
MSEFSCSNCDYITRKKQNVTRHINCKNKCWTGEAPTIIENIKESRCTYCNTPFLTIMGLTNHTKNNCQIKKNKDEANKKMITKIKEEIKEEIIEELEAKIRTDLEAKIRTDLEAKIRTELEAKIRTENAGNITNIANTANISNTANITNNNVTNNIVIQITPYNHPNLEDFERYYIHAIARITMSVPTLIKHIHFNKNKAENHSIIINNFRTKIAKVYDGHEWKTKDEDELIEELIDTYERLLEDWAYGDPEKMVHLNTYLEIKDRDGIDNVHNVLKKEIKKLIYDKRDMVKGTITKIKNG